MACNCCVQVLQSTVCGSFLSPKFVTSLTLSAGGSTRRPRLASLKSYSSMSSGHRRSAGYHPNSWSLEFLESSANGRGIEVEKEIRNNLEEEVGRILDDGRLEPLALLELIDDFHRLGLGYLFEEKTKRALDRLIYQSLTEDIKQKIGKSMHASALYFQLLRQHGHAISTDILESFMANGNFSTSLTLDTSDLLSLYEASHLAFDGEIILDKAREFASFHLGNMLGDLDTNIAGRITHALELPFHHRMQRLEARWNIETYDDHRVIKAYDHRLLLYKLAHFDFNFVQYTYQRDLAELTWWWMEIDLAKKLSFARDRLMECFFWGVGMVFQPQHSKSKKGVAKAFQLVTIIDDIYDVYGLPEELEQFTDAVERWDISAVEDLPDYMKICFLAFYNTVNDVAYDFLKEKGLFIIPHLSKVWADLCKAFLKEAKWNYEKRMPSFNEYISNGWVSSSGAVLLVHAYISMSHEDFNLELVKNLIDYPDIVRLPSTIFRLANDLSSSEAEIERGETVNAISCYMQEKGESEEVARAQIKKMIDESWKKMNREMLHNSLFNKSFIETAFNLSRIAQCQYQYGDGHSNPNISRNRISSVIVEPIQYLVKTEKINHK